MKLNKKGFVNLTVIYSFVILISLIMLLILKTLNNQYYNNLEYVEDINESLHTCLNNREC